jgi:hypothetical protein
MTSTSPPKTDREWFENEIYKTILRFSNAEIHDPRFADVWLQLQHWRPNCIDDIERKQTENTITNLKRELAYIPSEYHMMRALFERLIATMEKARLRQQKHTLLDGVINYMGRNRVRPSDSSQHGSVIPAALLTQNSDNVHASKQNEFHFTYTPVKKNKGMAEFALTQHMRRKENLGGRSNPSPLYMEQLSSHPVPPASAHTTSHFPVVYYGGLYE